MNRTLIVNADDCNLTAGVVHAILDSHDYGIVTSTTFLINLPMVKNCVREIEKRKMLGVGLHLNVTLGRPVSQVKSVSSLVDDGIFRRNQNPRRLKCRELTQEYENQILLFRKVFSRMPTHLDTHHQLHDHPLFFRILTELARKYRLPVRRSQLMTKNPSLRTPEHFFGDLKTSHYWKPENFYKVISYLPFGISEVMCHPGKVDRDLRSISSFTAGREKEWRLFRSPQLRKQVFKQGIQLSHYGLCYT